ncbi:hypothetical protein [Salipiger sp. PrR002]|uniref:hypothetical protein n=1 Tax=Salipiger sp. PrR002 TaxID=2706489 RepID=UPI0013BA37B1|nr:hypothetical protein [Salipiger sp. PrR002]NDV98913.1 hypothetical protein [Salipiger sp. PrR002]NDW55650.1 hypothetical protein [Salipiger sp. PrR004]
MSRSAGPMRRQHIVCPAKAAGKRPGRHEARRTPMKIRTLTVMLIATLGLAACGVPFVPLI